MMPFQVENFIESKVTLQRNKHRREVNGKIKMSKKMHVFDMT